MEKFRSSIGGIILVAAAIMVLSGCGGNGSSEAESDSQTGKVAAARTSEKFILYDIRGNQRRWSEFIGRPFMINFWATWCGPCRSEMPLLKKIYEEYHPQGLEIIGISVDHQRNRVAPFVEHFDIPYVILYSDNNAPRTLKLGQGIPMTIFFNAEGNETGRIIGAQPPQVFYKEVRKLFGS
jgi:thiol-disulfide isomerase/thioredoxin